MKAKLVRIGNSRGVRIPKSLIEVAGLTDEVEIELRDGKIVIAPATGTRAGWVEAAQAIHAAGENVPLLDLPESTFDRESWTW